MHKNIPELVFSKRWKIGYRGELFESTEIKEKAIKFAMGLRDGPISFPWG